MKKKISIPQLNNKTIVKFLVFFAVLVLLEVIVTIAIVSQFSTKAYKQEYAAFNNRAIAIQSVLENKYNKDDLNKLNNDSSIQQQVLQACKECGGFEGYAIVKIGSNSKNSIIYYTDLSYFSNVKNFSDIGIANNDVSVSEVGDKTLIFVPISVGTYGYGVLCVSDFSASQANINGLIGNVIAFSIVFCVLALAIFIGYAYSVIKNERPLMFRYKLTLSKEGKIISANKSFKDDFSAVGDIKSPESIDRKGFTLMPLPSNNGEDSMLALRAVGSLKGLTVYGGMVANASSFIQANQETLSAGMSTTSLSNVFETFVKKGKRALLGVLFIGHLEQIKTLFGKQTALDVQKIILKKTKEKFTYAFELDFGFIGVAYPDGKKLDTLMSDLNDIFTYINEPLKVDDNLFTLEMKGGFAMCDETMNPRTFDYAFKAAEAARQRAIDTKIADYIVYHESQKKLYTSYLVTFDIKQMLSEGAFEMEYQPQYSIKEARVEGFEALFRVKKSWNVNVDTFSFITYAERTGAMVQLGDFIFDTGMKFAKSIEGKNVSVSLNVSPVQLMQAGFIENFLRLYRKYDLQPGSICVEITESFLMTNFEETLKKLTVLTQQGILVHLDDFGTEYSSLLYIKKLPISTIKIDKGFVKDVLDSRESQAIIKFITNIAKLLNGTTICEGVETCKEFDMLNYLGCDTIQGWLISKSLKPDVAAKFIDEFDYKQVVAANQNK